VRQLISRSISIRKAKVCFVPSYQAEDRVYYPVPRTGKRSTLLACIAVDEFFLKPTVVIPQQTYDEDLLLFRMKSEKVELDSPGNDDIVT
jgi:hypothetical protein